MTRDRNRWSAEDVGDQTGRVALVTGANSGIGLEAARVLAGRGATVLLGCRDLSKAERARDSIAATNPGVDVAVLKLDLADLAAVRTAAEEVAARHDRLDLLLNNAGVMAMPYGQTVDGFELHLGVNHLGHVALTDALLPLLAAAEAPRVVTVTSAAHRMGQIAFDDLQSAGGYRKWPAYGQSKLANLLFTFELQRRAAAAGMGLVATSAHPGYTATNLLVNGQRASGSWLGVRLSAFNGLIGQSSLMGALPTLYAATEPGLRGGELIGPDRFGGMRGRPTLEEPSAAARDADAARRLWDVSAELTGARFALLEPAA